MDYRPRRRLLLFPSIRVAPRNNLIFLSHLSGLLFVGTATHFTPPHTPLPCLASWLLLLLLLGLIHPSIGKVRRGLVIRSCSFGALRLPPWVLTCPSSSPPCLVPQHPPQHWPGWWWRSFELELDSILKIVSQRSLGGGGKLATTPTDEGGGKREHG